MIKNKPILYIILAIIFIAIVGFFLVNFWLKNSIIESFFSKNSNKRLLYFFSNNCSHCRSFMPVWKLFADNYNMNDCVSIQSIDVNSNNNATKKYNVTTVPTILAIKETIDDEYRYKMTLPKTYNNLVSFYTQFRGI